MAWCPESLIPSMLDAEDSVEPPLHRVASSSLLQAISSETFASSRSSFGSGGPSNVDAVHEEDAPSATSPEHPTHTGNYNWLVSRINSGESVALLSLSGNTAVSATPSKVGSEVSYTVRGAMSVEGSAEQKLEALTSPFEYTVLDVLGDDKGRAIVLRPKARPRSLYLAFRGVRVGSDDDIKADAGAKRDRDNFCRSEPVSASWLPSRRMRVHAGALDHHESIWEGLLEEKLKVLAATVRRAAAPLNPKEAALRRAGLGGARAKGWEGSEVPDEILFVGLSLGGARPRHSQAAPR